MSSTRGASGPTPARGALRWLRGGVVGVVATLLAATGHAGGGGVVPSPAHLALAAAGGVLVAVALSGRRWRLPSLLGLLLGTQVVVHVAFSTGADLRPVTMPVGGMVHPMAGAVLGTPSGMGSHAMPGPTMATAHVVAALLTAVLLRRGEEWCWSLVTLLVRPLHVLRWTPVPVADRPGVPPTGAPAPHTLLLDRAVSRRGPPAPVPA